ncbi:universal stress protein [Priestia taiwanensis]|uniref:Universal stress protein n=1 Tax=Priestia taiwanensis TaxID=1347902 RepID=A0A917AWA1_9BACI|nr:universal stress protein [Priestia taiwanensis]MBM7363449.1 nucleotide-binding universal stress UspA family protein [Priestia taiwanensis]GGE77059.1 universal stress protein [Priestia taiwanensis]
MLTYQNILVAVDGSKQSELALKKAISITKRNNATLHIVHVLETKTHAEMEACKTVITDRMIKYAEDLLQEYRQLSYDAGVLKVLTILEHGDPRIAIPRKLTPLYEIDLIMCGATGLSTIERFFVGSVSEHITRHATCDVLIVRNANA